jgi:MFS family permease
MVMIANLQYGWTLFVNPIDEKYHWGRAAIQVAFTIFVLTETWLVPFEGYLIDKFGPRIMVGLSGDCLGDECARRLIDGALCGGRDRRRRRRHHLRRISW